MSDLAFRDGVMDQIRQRESRYEEGAYLFVLAALYVVGSVVLSIAGLFAGLALVRHLT